MILADTDPPVSLDALKNFKKVSKTATDQVNKVKIHCKY